MNPSDPRTFDDDAAERDDPPAGDRPRSDEERPLGGAPGMSVPTGWFRAPGGLGLPPRRAGGVDLDPPTVDAPGRDDAGADGGRADDAGAEPASGNGARRRPALGRTIQWDDPDLDLDQIRRLSVADYTGDATPEPVAPNNRSHDHTDEHSHGDDHEVSVADILDGRSEAEVAPNPEVTADEVLRWGDAPSTAPPATEPSPIEHDDRRARPFEPPVIAPKGLRARVLRRRYGVAPFVPPPARRSRRKRRRDYRRQGFIELSPEKQKRRHKILPRTVIGISFTLLALAVGTAFSGAALYAYYDARLTENEAQVEDLVEGFDGDVQRASEDLRDLREQSLDQIDEAVEPLQEFLDDTNAVAELPATLGGSVWTVRTLDVNGQPAVGSSFVIASDAESSLLLTSFDVVRAATAAPGPPVTIEHRGSQVEATVWSWDEDHDLALLRIDQPGLEPLEWADAETNATAVGTRAYAMSGLGGAGATVAPGVIVDQFDGGIRHDVDLGTDHRGGPIVDADGAVIGIASNTYDPLQSLEAGHYAPPILTACTTLVSCSEDMWATGGPTARDN
ncbi:MAG: serine protease [Actinomycetota bacterium]|nr:serine protease [Actinomycetota bacterium]